MCKLLALGHTVVEARCGECRAADPAEREPVVTGKQATDLVAAVGGGLVHFAVFSDHASLRLEYPIFLIVAGGMQVAGFTTQAHFLMGLGIERYLQQAGGAEGPLAERITLARQAMMLTLPGGSTA